MNTGSALLLAVGLFSAAAVANARWPRQGPGLRTIIGSWFAAMLVVELAAHLMVFGAALVVLNAVLADGLTGPAGWVGLVIWAGAVAVALPYGASSFRTRIDIDGSPENLDVDDAPRVAWWQLLFPWLLGWRPGVKKERGRVYATVDGQELKLDIVRSRRATAGPRPAVIHVHGGVWLFGSRHEQGLPLLSHLAANGWVGFNIDYRLSPKATMPEHVEDVKRAIAWVREHADELGVDPSFIALTGGSAGGHLTALAALTSADDSLQPGFESSDAAVQAAIPFYGVYGLAATGEDYNEGLKALVENLVVKAKLEEEPEKFDRVSPLARIGDGPIPPFLVVHGTGDTIVPVAESRHFVQALRKHSDEPVLYAEMPGGQHSFDSMTTWRSAPVMRAVERFLATTYASRGARAEHTERKLEEVLTD
ncbi:MAG: alpha/beta hydrolase [Solirubrobacteraceae bacterium]|nr:alpha/beta hydrolase [Solirubrobacteraceae bacterium]